MKAWILNGPNDIEYTEIKRPVPKRGEVLINVKACGICGSDIPRVFRTGAHRHPIIPGHEFSGCVVDAYDKDSMWIGKRVGVFPLISCGECEPCGKGHPELCRNYNYLGSRSDGGFAEYVIVPENNIVELPENISYEVGAMLEPMAVALHAIKRISIEKTEGILVIGLGTIGLFVTMLLKALGYENIYVVGNKDFQKEMVLKLGVKTENYYQEEDLPKMDVVFECVGKNESLSRAIECASPMGRVVAVGNPYGDMTLDKDVYWRILRNQLEVTGTWNSTFLGEKDDDWNQLIAYLRAGSFHPEQVITHKYLLSELINGLVLMRDKTDPYVKVMMVNE